MRSSISVACLASFALALSSCTSKDPETLKREYVASGDRYSAQQKYSEAIIQYRNALTQDARFGEARSKLAEAYQAVGDAGSATREYIRAADLLPNDATAQVRAATLLLGSGRFADAQARAARALELEPQNVNALLVVGNALARLRDLDGAVQEIEGAIDANPQYEFSYANLGWLQVQKGDADAAERAFKRAIEVSPKSVPAHLNIANFYWAARRRPDAERELKEALRLDPKAAETNRLLAAFYLTNGQRDEGEVYAKAYAQNSGLPEAKLALADFYLNGRREPEALPILTELAGSPSTFARATLRLAYMNFAKGRKAEAYTQLESILKRTPNDELALHAKARFTAADRKLDEALALIDKVLKLNPRAVKTMYLRAGILREQGRLDDAIAAAQSALQLAPTSFAAQGYLAELYLQKNDGKAALELSNQLVRLQPRLAPVRFVHARALFLSGQITAAQKEFETLATAQPDAADARIWLGQVYLAQNNRAKAREAFTRAAQLDPASLLALNGLVTLDIVEKNQDAARARLDARLSSSKPNSELLFLSANSFMLLGDVSRAESLFRQVLALDANNIDAYTRLAAIYLQKGSLDEAERQYQDAAKRQSRPVAILTFLGMVSELRHRPDDARKYYEQVLALDNRAAVAANNLAWILAERGERLDEALQLAQTAKAVLPKHANVSNTLGWVFYKKGLVSQAVTALKESVDSNPQDPSKYYYLGLAYLKNNQATEARGALERALKLNPQFPHAADARQALASIKG